MIDKTAAVFGAGAGNIPPIKGPMPDQALIERRLRHIHLRLCQLIHPRNLAGAQRPVVDANIVERTLPWKSRGSIFNSNDKWTTACVNRSRQKRCITAFKLSVKIDAQASTVVRGKDVIPSI